MFYGTGYFGSTAGSPVVVSAVPDSASAIGFEELWAPGVDAPTNGALEEHIARLLANGTTKRSVRKIRWTGGRPVTEYFDDTGTQRFTFDHHPTTPSITGYPAGSYFQVDSNGGFAPLQLAGDPVRMIGGLQFTSDISPTALTATTFHNYDPTGLSTATVIRQDASGNAVVTGLAGGTDGRMILLLNISAANSITLNTADAGSTAGNQFLLKANLAIAAKGGVLLCYDSTSTKWRAVSVY